MFLEFFLYFWSEKKIIKTPLISQKYITKSFKIISINVLYGIIAHTAYALAWGALYKLDKLILELYTVLQISFRGFKKRYFRRSLLIINILGKISHGRFLR